MRVWRALKAGGAGILRDGVYVLPESPRAGALLRSQAIGIEDAGGSAYLLPVPADTHVDERFVSLFDRNDDYAEWRAVAAEFLRRLESIGETEARRSEAKLRRACEAIVDIDFFPREAQADALGFLQDLGAAVNARFSPDEPTPRVGSVRSRSPTEFQGRLWATRRGLWVDRVASAWLIRGHIDSAANFAWLEQPGDCPEDAVGFDFDGAEFTHVGDFVTFEVLLQSFGLDRRPALRKLGDLVHYADVGGPAVADAAGFMTMLAGIKQAGADDDALLHSAGFLLDHLSAAYESSENTDSRA